MDPDGRLKNTLYLPSLEGVRFIAFLLVFIHHCPRLAGHSSVISLQDTGWIGVEIFFVISAFLFFHLFSAERNKTGAINIRQFLVRRVLRLYPLMVAFPLLMILLFATKNHPWMRLAAIALGAENFVDWFAGFDSDIMFIAHLWTLSFELQVYLVIPAAFLAYQRLDRNRFLVTLGVVFLFCLFLRLVFVAMNATHPIVWVTPFLRPESVLAGIALSIVGLERFRPIFSAVILGAAVALFFYLFDPARLPWITISGAISAFPLIALVGAALLVLSLTWGPLRSALAWRPIAYLGSISYGLYVCHILAIYMAQVTFAKLGILPHEFNTAWLFSTFVLTSFTYDVVMASVSYFILERPFLLLKRRFEVVHGKIAA